MRDNDKWIRHLRDTMVDGGFAIPTEEPTTVDDDKYEYDYRKIPYFGDLLGSAADATANYVAGAAEFLGADDIAKYSRNEAQKGQERLAQYHGENKTPELSMDYILSPNGLTRAIGSVGGSLLTSLAVGKMLTPASAVAGLTGLASKAPMVGKYAETLASGIAQSIPATGFEAISQGGNWMLDQQEKGNMTPEQIQQGGRDVALENAGVLLGSNAIEMGLLGKYLGGLSKAIHGKRTGIKTATAIPEMAANLGLQSAEEGWQRGIDLKHEGKDYSYNPVDWFTDPKYSEQLAETKEGFAGLAPFSFLGVGGNYMSNRAVAKKYEGDEWESAFEEYKGKQMDNGKKGCVEAATKIGAKAGSPWLAKQLDDKVVDGDTLLQNAKNDGLEIIEFNPDKVERGDIILYDKKDGEENSHTVLADGLGGVWGNSSSNLRVEEYDSYNMGDNLVPARIIKTGTYDGEFADGEQGDFDTFVDRIGLNESGNNYDAVNSDSGASGKYQIMPENWGAWAEEAGLDANAEMTPENQEKVARHKLKQYYDKYGEAGALVAWYAGEANAERYANGEKTDIWGKEWTSPQGEYPSIQSYIDNTLGQNVKPKKKPARVNIDSDETVETDSKSSVPSLEEYMKMFDEGGTEQKSYSDYLAIIENASDEQVVANAKKELDNLSKNGDMENYSLFKELLDDGNVEELRNIAVEQASQGSGVVEQNNTPTETFDFFGMANQLRDMADNSTEEQREAITQALSSNAPLMMYHALDGVDTQRGESLSEEETNRMNEVLNSSAMPNNVKTELSGMFNDRNYDGVRQMLGTIPDSVRPQAETNPQAQASVEDEKALWEQTQANLDRNTQSQQAQRIAQEQANRVYDNAPLSPQEVRAVNNVLNSADGVVSPAIKDELRKAFNGNDFAGVRKVISGMPDNLPTQAETNQRNMAEVQKAIDNARYNINRAMQEFEDFKNMLDPFEREFMEVLETVYGEYGRKFDSLLKSLRYYKGEAKKKIIKAQKEKNEQAVAEAQKEQEGYNYAIEGLEGIAVKAREYEARRETIGRKGTSNADEQSSGNIHQKAPSREVIELVKTYGTMLKDRLIDNNVPINEQAVDNALNSEKEDTVNNVVERMENIAEKNGVPTKDLKEQSDREQSEKELTLKEQLKAVKAEKEELLKPYLEYIEKTSGNGIEIVPSNDGSRRGLRVSKNAEWYQKWREANKSEETPNPVLRSKKQKLEVAERMYRGEIETDINSFRPKTKEEANEYKAEIQRMNTEMDTLNSVITELENQIADEKAKTEQAKAERKAQKEKNKSQKKGSEKKNTPKTAVSEQESREGVSSKSQRETPSDTSERPTQGKSEGRISDNKAKKSNEKEFTLNDIQIYESELKDIISDGNIKAKYTGKLVNGKPHYDITFESQGDYEKFYSAYYGESEDVDNFADNETEENDNFEIEDGLVKLSAKKLKEQSDINRKEQLNMVKTEFPTAKNIKQNGDSISFKLFGHNVVVNFADHIVASEAEKEAYRRDYGEEYTDDVEILGKTETIDGTQIITLLKSGEKDTISHEAFHLAFRTVLTKEQQDMLLAKYGDEEAVAEAYRKLMGKSNARGTMFDMSSKLGRLFQKIWNFANSLFNVLSKGSLLHDAESVMYAIADGSIYDINNGKKGIEAYIHPSLLAAWHGTPHLFDKFSTEFMGKGEGVQAHGWGLYFALDKKIGDNYRKELTRAIAADNAGNVEDALFEGKRLSQWYDDTNNKMNNLNPKSEAYQIENDKYYMLEQTMLGEHPDSIIDEAVEDELSDKAISWYKKTIAENYPMLADEGYLYQVDIPSTDTMLREDAEFSKQPKQVQDGIKATINELVEKVYGNEPARIDMVEWAEEISNRKLDKNIPANELQDILFNGLMTTSKPMYHNLYRTLLFFEPNPKELSMMLNRHGIEGISYNGGQDGECCVIFNGKAVKILERNGEPVNDADEHGVKFRAITDKKKISELNKESKEGNTTKTYRAMAEIDGKLYPPMATKVDKDNLAPSSKIGVWEEAVADYSKAFYNPVGKTSKLYYKDIKPIKKDGVWQAEVNGEWVKLKTDKNNDEPSLFFDLIKDNGDSVPARFNPYIHSSLYMLNDQFSTAYKRPNLVVVEMEIPNSELSSGYRAEYAKDPVGRTKWKSGDVVNKLVEKDPSKGRDVFITRYARPVRVVPVNEVAQAIKEQIGDTGVAIPINVVTPNLAKALTKAGVELTKPQKQYEKGYNEWVNKSNNTKLMAFAGKRATKVAPQNSLDTAMQMEKEGKSAEEIYKSTEWFKGKDNKWKYEIPDNLDSIDLSKLKDDKAVKLGDIYDNEKLFSAYPELKDIDVVIEDLEEIFYGLYTEEDNLMSLDESYIKKEPNEIKKTILHEMQHAIQKIEGFAKGANSKFAMMEVNIEMDNVLKKLFGNKDNALGYIRKINQLKKALVNPEKNLATIKRLTHSKPLDEVKELVGRFDNLYEGIKKVAKLSSRKQNEAMYDMSAGEQESREVERRAEENDKSMPVPHKDDAVVVFGDEEIPIRASKSAISQTEAVRKKYEGTDKWMKAPNGKPTNLTEEQWLQVRTPNFKNWFGDWENDPENASKVVDKNGEPLVVYHGTDTKFDTFDLSEVRDREGSFFFAEQVEDAESYAVDVPVMKVFVNVRNPFDYENGEVPSKYQERWNSIKNKREQVAILKELGYDGWTSDFGNGDGWGEISAFNSNQIKSATENSGEFSTNNNNIRLSAKKKVIDKAKTTINNFLNNRNTELNERELTRRLEDLSGLKVKWGRVDSADKAILKTLEGVIRAKKRYDFESIVPLMGDAICQKLHLPTGDEAMNAYITQWLLTGESQPNTRIGMAFKKAMKQNAAYANQLIDVQLSFVQWNSLDADIRQARTIKDGTEKGTRKDKAKSFFEKIHDQFIEELGPVKRMVDEIEKVKGEKLKINLNPYIAFRMFRGHYGKAMVMVEGKTNKAVNALKTLFPSADVHWENFKTLQMIFDEVGVSTAQDIKEFAVYCAAKHFKDINVRNTENEQKINSAKAVLEKAKDKEYAKSHKDEVEKARNTLNAFKDWQPYTVPSSFTEADCDKTISKYQNNAKFVQGQKDVVNYSKTLVDICYSAGLMSEERYNQMRNSWENYVPLHRSFAENENIWGDSFKHMTGSAENITNPFETLIHNTFEFMKQAEKNKAKRLLADVASMSDLGAIIENVPEGSAMGNTIRYYVDGKIRYLEAEPQVVNAINNMGMSAVSWYAKFFKTISSVARACFTSLNPSFVIRNALRDVQDAAVYNKGLTPYDFFYGFKEAIKHGFATLGKGSDSEKYYEWLASGAAQASAVALDRNYSVATMKKITKTWDLTNISDFGSAVLNYLQAFSEYSEYGTRIGVYEGTKRNVKKNNKNATNAAAILEAAYMSRDQMDFARGGKASRDWNNWAIFANASIQGWDKFYRALKDNPRSVLTKISMACMCTYALSFMFDYDDEWYKELPDFQKQNFWIMKFGDTIWRIPKGQDVGLRFFTNAVDKMIGVTTRGEKANAESYFKPVQDLLPSILPTALLPAIEAMTNYSIFREAPIVPGYQQRLPEYMQYSPNSSGVAKGIASLSRFFGFETGISPRKIDHLIYGYGGSVVTGLAQLGGLLYDGAMGDGVQIDYTNITKYPILSGITAEIMKNPNSVTEFYKEYDKQNRFNAEYKQTKKKPDGYDPALYKRMDRANKLLSKYNKQEREILMDKKLTPEAKNAKLKVLSEKRVSVVKKVMKK